MATEPPLNAAQGRAYLLNEFHKHWETEEAFSEAKLNELRSGTRPPDKPNHKHSFLKKYILDAEIPAEPSAVLDNDVHPLFQDSNWLTNLPMDEVRDQLRPAFQLASKFITDDRALHWFAHVRFSSPIKQKDGPTLLGPAGAITTDKLDKVKKSLLGLLGRGEVTGLVGGVRFSWAGNLDKNGDATSHRGKMRPNFSTIVKLLKGLPHDSNEMPELYQYNKVKPICQPMAFINASYFHTAMRHRYQGASPAAQKVFQFMLAKTIVHEFAHVWVFLCHHKTCADGEPLVFPNDPFPEGGFSWETFMFGAAVNPSKAVPDLLTARTYASVFREPRHYLCAYVPQKWLTSWFLNSTWDDFAALHQRGDMYAPSPDRQVKHFVVRRFCKMRMKQVRATCVDGRQRSKRCGADAICAGNDAAANFQWPDSPEQVLAIYLGLIKADAEVARSLGSELYGLGIPVCYEKRISRMGKLNVPLDGSAIVLHESTS